MLERPQRQRECVCGSTRQVAKLKLHSTGRARLSATVKAEKCRDGFSLSFFPSLSLARFSSPSRCFCEHSLQLRKLAGWS